MKKWRIAPLLIAAAMTCLFLTSCAKKTPENEKIRIGIILPKTGAYASFGAEQKRGYDMALADIEKDPGFSKRIEVVLEDDMSSEEKAMAAARKLITDSKASALIGSYSSACTFSTIEIANLSETPMIVASGAADTITRKGFPWIFRINAPSSTWASSIIKFFKSLREIKTVGILYENSIMGTSTSQLIEKYAKDEGLKVTFSESYDNKEMKFAPVLVTRIKKNTPDAVVLISYLEDGIELMKLFKKHNINPKLFFGTGAGFTLSKFIDNAKDVSEYLFNISQWSPDMESAESKRFVESYKKLHDETPTYHCVQSYSALMVMAEAIKKAKNTDKEGIQKSLLSVDMVTPFARVRFETYDGFTNQNRHEMVIHQIQGKRFVLIWPPEARKGEIIFPVPSWGARGKK